MRYLSGVPHDLPGGRTALANYHAKTFRYSVEGRVATIELSRPERKNPLTFESYAELRDLFGLMEHADDVRAVVLTGSGDNFCSGGDVHEIIGPLTKLDMPGLLAFTRMTGALVKAMKACRSKPKKRRASCERQANKKYGPAIRRQAIRRK